MTNSTPQKHENRKDINILEETEIGSSRDQETRAASVLSVSDYFSREEVFSLPRSPLLWNNHQTIMCFNSIENIKLGTNTYISSDSITESTITQLD